MGMGFHFSKKLYRRCNNRWKTVYSRSRFTTGAKSRYTPVEGEALLLAWAPKKTCHFTLGNDMCTVYVDHKPLLKILSNRKLVEINNPVYSVPHVEQSVVSALCRYCTPLSYREYTNKQTTKT